MKHNVTLVRQSWAFLTDFSLQMVKRLMVQVQIKSLAVSTPPNRQQNHLVVNPGLETNYSGSLLFDHDRFSLMLL